jgi:hypothetical protein
MSNEEKAKYTFPGRKPVRIGKCNLPSEIALYMEQLPSKVMNLSHDDEGNAIIDAGSAYSAPANRKGGKRSYVDATQGTQFTTQASLKSGPTLAPSQGSTILDEKFKEAMTQFAAQSKQMEDKQKELQSFKDMTETRFRNIEEKLGTLVDMFKKSSTTQHTMQDTLTEQQG